MLNARYRDRAATGSDEEARDWLARRAFVFNSQVSAAWTLAHQP